jgi:hypothetical protein
MSNLVRQTGADSVDGEFTMEKMFEAIDVWRRDSETRLIRYRCFKELSSQRYSVQSADFYHLPLDAKHVADLDHQFVELLAEQRPNERARSYASLIEAIEAHDREFNAGKERV